jgi:hypothetical protein
MKGMPKTEKISMEMIVQEHPGYGMKYVMMSEEGKACRMIDIGGA